MKTAVACLVLLATTVTLRAQGTVAFNNNGSTAFRLWTNYGSPPQYMSGANAFRIGLYVSTDLGAAESSLGLVALATNTPIAAGRFNGGNVSISGTAPGEMIRFQVRFWSLGAGASWQEAIASAVVDPLGVVLASSPLGTVTLGDNLSPGQLFGFGPGQIQGFGPVPEPSTGALTLLATLTGFSFLRRKRAPRS